MHHALPLLGWHSCFLKMHYTSIMLIDDGEDDRDILFQAIMTIDQSCTFSGFENGSDAFKLLNDSGTILPDLFFLDLNMPV